MSLQVFNSLKGSFQGLNSAGAITLQGARVGDEVHEAYMPPIRTSSSYLGSFEGTISVDNQIQQTSSSPLSAYTFTVVLHRPIVQS